MRYSVVFCLQSLLIAVFILGVPSCKKDKVDDCEDLNRDRVEVKVTEVELLQVLREPIGQETCNSIASNIPCFIEYKDKEKVKASALSILFGSKTMPKTLFTTSYQKYNGLFVAAAQACDVVPEKFTNQKITSLQVKSNAPFNKDFPAGADLSPLLTESYSKQKIVSADINLLRNTHVSFSEDVALEYTHVLTFTFVLDNIDTLSFATPPIIMVKE